MAGQAAVGVDDDLPAGEPGVPVGAADHESPRRVHDQFIVLRQQVIQRGLDDRRSHRLFDRVVVDVVGVLGRDQDPRHVHGTIIDVANRHLGLSVWTEEGDRAVSTAVSEVLCQSMGCVDRGRHETLRLVRCVAEHEALIAGTQLIERVL